MTVALEASGVSVEFPSAQGPSRVVDGVDVSVGSGEILGLVGPSGSGKSILARALLNLVPEPGRLVGGTVSICSQPVLSLDAKQLRKLRGDQVGVILPNARACLNPLIPVGDQVANVYRAHRQASRQQARERAIEALQDTGLPAPVERYDAYPHELSGGMAQRAMIAMALICSPRLIIADEPTSGLDVTIQDQILKLFRSAVAERDASALLISRDMGIIANFCDRVAVMHKGRIVETAEVSTFFASARDPLSLELIAAASYKSGESGW